MDENTVSLNAGCCGLSGTFGLKTDNFDMSMKIAQPLMTKITLAHPDVVATSCGVCQTQIRQGVSNETEHPLRLLHEALP